ncbi:MAG: hypothetical protein Q7K28_03550, partial [Candidatus Wildermuthbacteria bacterium]|nr:hypothetical protein [Candidatus Wildermuthbacteria bacterium]
RILGLGYPGGPAISAEAEKYKIQNTLGHSPTGEANYKLNLPRPMMYTKDYDFSFSGLKTAVLYEFQKRPLKVKKSKKYIVEMCYEIQQSIIDVLIKKTIKAAKDFKVKSIILGGGVAANTELRRQFSYKLSVIGYKLNFLVPDKIYCTDNAAMVAVAAYFHRKEKGWKNIKADGNLQIC